MWKFVLILAIAASLLLTSHAGSEDSSQCQSGDNSDCPADQELSECPDASCFPLSCDEVGYPIPGCGTSSPCPGDPDCVCKDGNVFDDCGNCIPPAQCPSCGGDENAVQGCGNNCGKKCSDLVNKQSFCTLSCKLNGCDCKDNFYYDSNKKICVPAEECTSICSGPNEEYDKCPGCSPQTCATRNNIYHCPMIPANKTGPNCTPACRCKKGYFRNSKNICVAASVCDDCPEDQVYSDCPDASCDALTCAEAGFQKKNCGTSDPCPGQPDCVCKGGYLKDANGNCIKSSECPSCGGDNNAIPGNSNYCGRTCADIGKNGTKICPLFLILNGCNCKPNYWYDTNTKKCVKANECTPTCKGNEEFSSCSNGLCRVQDCKDKGKTRPCPPMVPGSCIPGCVCPEKYLRKNGECVPEEQCDSPTCKANEEFSSCSNGLCRIQDCKDKGKTRPCPSMVPGSCIPGCVCPEKYLRKNGECVPEEQCDSIVCKGENEVYSNCTNGGCGAKQCSQLGYKVPCIDSNSDSCIKGCTCIDGYVRDDKGKCIPSNQCPSCGGDPNAEPGCSINCGRHCSNYMEKRPICPLRPCYINDCQCRPDYVFDDNIGKCVYPKDCTPVCKENEVFSNCTNGGCDARKCSQLGYPVPGCKKDASCKNGCICQPGYLRADNGTCIPSDQCPIVCKENEVYSNCTNGGCGAKYCSQLGYPQPCVDYNSKSCVKGCACINGYVRNESGKCIPSDQCPSCGGDPNAQPGCGINCGRHCSNYKNKHPICPRIACIINRCDCRPKFVYDDNLNRCVLPKDCTPTCKENEVFSNCTNGGCEPTKCSQLGYAVPCPKLNPAYCKKGCVCEPGYLRANNGTCIPSKQCPTPQCDEGEIYNTCPPVSCDAEYCPKNRNAPQSCPIPKKCPKNGKCVCGFNSLRDRKTKKCIPTRNCPPFACNKRNEVYDSCPPVCPGQTCKDYLNNSTCSKFPIRIVVACKPTCRCKPGYYRNSKEDCVSGQKCKDEQAASNCGCSSTSTNPDQNQNTDAASDELLLEEGSNAFSLKFLSELVKANPEVSVFSSPSSCLTPLAELAYYSKGPTATELLDVMNLKSKDQIPRAFPGFLKSFRVAEGTELDLANRIYVADPYKLSDSFKSVSENVFNATAETINFNQASQASSTINKWVSDATKGKITNLVSADMFNAFTRLVLANAIYFKGTWKTEFNPSNTQSSDFYVNADKTVQVQMMYQKNKFKYSNNNDIGAQVVEIPYLDTNVTFIMILPNEQYGLTDVVNKLQNPSISSTFLSGLRTETVKLYLPIMEVSTTSNLINILKPIGVKTIFTTNAELSGMIVPDESLYVSDATQKAYCLVNEKGSEAAAANAFVVSTRAAVMEPLEVVVRADHPFIFCIKVRNLHLFLGTYYG